MTEWETLLRLVADEAGDEAAERIAARARAELGGVQLSIPRRPTVTVADAHRAVREAKGDVDRAARRLNLSRSSVYRRLQRRPEPEAPGPTLPGTRRPVR